MATVFSLAVSAFPIVDVADASAYAAKVLGTTAVSNLAALVYYLARRRRIAPIPMH
jgi:glutamate:GABA antiporter